MEEYGSLSNSRDVVKPPKSAPREDRPVTPNIHLPQESHESYGAFTPNNLEILEPLLDLPSSTPSLSLTSSYNSSGTLEPEEIPSPSSVYFVSEGPPCPGGCLLGERWIPFPMGSDSNIEHNIPQAIQQIAILNTSEHRSICSDPTKPSPASCSTARCRLRSEDSLSAEQNSKYPLATSEVFQSERSFSSSETNSVGSFESDITDDELGEADNLLCQHIDMIPFESGAIILDLSGLITQALLMNGIPCEKLNQLSTKITAMLEQWTIILAVSQSAASGDAASPPCHSSQAGSLSAGTQSSKGIQKKTFDDENQDSQDHDDNNSRRKRHKTCGEIEVRCRQKWACPFYQREPHRYCIETEFGDFRKCARSPGFDQVHRVKDHIYKCHSPNYCDRCYTIFKESDDLINHRRMSPACDLKPVQEVEGLTSEQKKLLKPRDRRSKSDEERWQTIYKICFPEDEVIPGAYYVHYSREIAELRREVFAIIEEEARLPVPLDVTRMVQRLHGAFNNQFSTQNSAAIIPPQPGIPTPSTNNTNNSSANQSFHIPPSEESPSLRGGSRCVGEVTGIANDLIDPVSNEAIGSPASNATDTGLPPFSATEIPKCDNISAVRPVSPTPIQDLLGQAEPFDFDAFLQQENAAEASAFYPQSVGDPSAWNYSPEVAETLLTGQGILQGEH